MGLSRIETHNGRQNVKGIAQYSRAVAPKRKGRKEEKTKEKKKQN